MKFAAACRWPLAGRGGRAGCLGNMHQARFGTEVRFGDSSKSGPEIVIEFEPSEENVRPAMPLLRAMFARISRHHTSDGLFREATRQIRGLTGFDRAMKSIVIDEDGSSG